MTTTAGYLQLIRDAFEPERDRFDQEIERWRASPYTFNPLFGYAPPGFPVHLAGVAAFLYERDGDPALAAQAHGWLRKMQELTAFAPASLIASRPEYAELGRIPALEPVFQLLVFAPACERIRPAISPADDDALADMAADTLRTVWRFPEWGGHNRAMLRAAGLALCARAFPRHPDAPGWAALSDELAEESWGRWSIEDAVLYQPHWLRALFIYAEARGRDEVEQFIQPRLHLRATAQLLTPLGFLPDFGDSHWISSQWEWLACFEWAARTYRDPVMKWAAARILEAQGNRAVSVDEAARAVILAHGWCDDDLIPQLPGPTPDALDDLVSKKIVFRTGWDRAATYACLNYRDEGDYARVARDYLRTTLAVSAEKAHHGHSDEGSLVSLMHEGSVLLHDGGYRERPPDGMYRADIYHNRAVWRTAVAAAGGVLDFLRDDGHYSPVRAERLYWSRLGDLEFTRLRVTDTLRGVSWDRSVLFFAQPVCFVVLDSLRALRTGPFTFSQLWWTTDVLEQGSDWFKTAISRVVDWRNPPGQSLLLHFPGAAAGAVSRESLRRSFQDEICLAQTWRGELAENRAQGFVAALWPMGADEPPNERVGAVATLPAPDGLAVRIRWKGEERIVGLPHDLSAGWLDEDVRPRYTAERGNAAYGPLVSDAALAYVRRSGTETWAGFINGTYLACDGRELYRGRPHAMFQEDATARPGVPARFKWQSEVEQ